MEGDGFNWRESRLERWGVLAVHGLAAVLGIAATWAAWGAW